MIVQTIHEILNPFDVETPLGYGVALFIIAGSIHSNPQFIVKIYNSGIKPPYTETKGGKK